MASCFEIPDLTGAHPGSFQCGVRFNGTNLTNLMNVPIKDGDIMPITTPSGLARENHVLTGISSEYKARLEHRGVNDELLSNYAVSTEDMETKRASVEDARSKLLQLTEQESKAKVLLGICVRRVLEAVKNTFPKKSPQWKEFHVGKSLTNSTSGKIGKAKDVASACAKYQTELKAGAGLVQKDLDDLTAATTQLNAIDTQAEIFRKKSSPEATAALAKAIEEVSLIANFIHAAAAAEFVMEPKIAKQFSLARKLRYLPESKTPKQPPAPPSPPPAE